MCEEEKRVEVTEVEFERFKAEFERMVGLFGLVKYSLTFKHEHLEDDRLAEICADESSKIAIIRFTTKYGVGKGYTDFPGPEKIARHEALHLLVNRMVWIANGRFVTPIDIEEENEAIVTTLERFDYREPLTESDEKRKKHETEILIESMKRDF